MKAEKQLVFSMSAREADLWGPRRLA